MKLKPFAEIIALSKEKLAESLAPIRARKVKIHQKKQKNILRILMIKK